jgi:excinuclease ABC subunit B
MESMGIAIRTSLEEPETGQVFVPHRPHRPDKAEGGRPFRIVSDYQPSGDQPQAMRELVAAAPRRDGGRLKEPQLLSEIDAV